MDIATCVNEGFNAYRGFMQEYPHIGAMVTAEVTFLLGDTISQLITDRKVDPKKLAYTAKIAPIYGLCLDTLIDTGDLIGDNISEHPLAKSALGPNLFGNVLNSFFFVNNTVGEKKGYSIKKLISNYSKIFTGKKGVWKNFKERYLSNIPGKEFAYSVAATLTVWNAFQWYNYSQVSDEMRTPLTLTAGVVWMSLLSLWSLKGRRKIVDKSQGK